MAIHSFWLTKFYKLLGFRRLRSQGNGFRLFINVFAPFLFLISASFPCIADVDQTSIENAIKKVEGIIESNLQSKRIPGCSVAVVYRNQVVYLRGFGLCKLGGTQPITPDTVFQLGSVSKPIAATLAVVLENKGLLNIDAPVSTYLPNFSLNTKQPRESFTVKNILTHTSGVPRGGFNNMIEHFATHQEIVDALQQARVVSRSGVRYDYNNAMYSLISDVIQSATHQSFGTALSQYLLIPLHMTQTSTSLEGILSCPSPAHPHTRDGRGVLCACTDYSKGYYAVAPAGGINSSARDMANFLKAQMGGYPNVVPIAALNRMHAPYIETNNLLGGVAGAQRAKHPHYGFGWRIVEYANQPLIFHGGWLRGFTNFIGFLPKEKFGIVILHNGDTKFSAKTAMKFFETALNLPEAPEPKTCGKGKGKCKTKAKAAKPAKATKTTKAQKAKSTAGKKSGSKSKKKK